MASSRVPGPLGADGLEQTWCRAPGPGPLGTLAPVSPPLSTPGPIGLGDFADVLANGGGKLISAALIERNLLIERALLDGADRYEKAGDLRWFFAYSHGAITKQINANLIHFDDPNALLLLNIHFAEEFIRAIDGHGHELWTKAFRLCQSLQSNESVLMMEAELCGAQMAAIHINIDLKAALRVVGCISAKDYGNMLVFVNRGSLAAVTRLRGRAIGSAQVMMQALIGPMLDLDVKAWRNAAFQALCNTPVPDPIVPFPPLPVSPAAR